MSKVMIGGIGNVSKELKYIYKASDCSDKSDCRIAIDQVNELKKKIWVYSSD